MINPTIALSGTSGLQERQTLAERFHIHTVLTCHQPGNINMSQNTSINESIVVMRRNPHGPRPSTRFIHLDRMPVDESEIEDLHRCLRECQEGQLSNGWGGVSQWPAERIEGGDWTPAIWRSPELAEYAARFSNGDATLNARSRISPGYLLHSTYQVLHSNFERSQQGEFGSFPILASKGSEGQTSITSTPDEYWIPKRTNEETRRILEKAGHLLITQGQRNNTGRLTATASDQTYVGIGYLPITGLTAEESKATAVFINSTPGRLQLMRNAGRTIEFPLYNPAASGNLRIPDIKSTHRILRYPWPTAWERTRDMEVPQFRDGECEVRRLWDDAVAEAIGWDPGELARLRELLTQRASRPGPRLQPIRRRD